MRGSLALVLLVVSAAACNPNSEEAFTRGKSLVACLQNIPACPAGGFAACTLNETMYTEQRFPDASPFRFLVSALARETIAVTLFFKTEQGVGLDTRIFWYEPGCADVYSYESQGADLFAEAEEENTITRKERVYEGGDHLVEIFSDMQAVVLITVEVLVPQRYDL